MAPVLIVDHEPSTRAFIISALQAAGHSTLTVSSGREALAAVERHACCAVVIEVLMPEVDGVEIIAQLRRAGFTRPIIALSGGGALVSAAEALKLAQGVGADAILRKPFSSDEIVACLASALAARETDPVALGTQA